MDPKSITRKLSAILSADVQGYSRLMGDDEIATVETITEYRDIVTSLVTQWKGRVVDSPGDNILAEFASVVDAVQCAVEMQNVLKAKNEELPENRRMIFRIGINLGDVIFEGDRIYGDGVNIAARIESLADGGGICVSGTAYDHIENKLALGYSFIGEHSVKNIAKPIRVYKVPMEPKNEGKKIGAESRKTWTKVLIGILVLGITALIAWNLFQPDPGISTIDVSSKQDTRSESPEKMAPALTNKPSIAVLPFTNLSKDPGLNSLADEIAEDIITDLSKTPKLIVAARNLTFPYKDKPVKAQEVSKELGVRYVLKGSIRKSGDRARITAQLIDAKTENHIWSERYVRDLKDLFALQDEITMKVIKGVNATLGERRRTKSHLQQGNRQPGSKSKSP